jgi:hypothetical protein
MSAPAIPHQPRRRRRWPLFLLLAVAALAGAHAAALYWMAGQIQQGLEAWAAQRRVQGWQVEYGLPQRGGWPWVASLRLPGVGLATGSMSWQAEAVTLSVSPQALNRLHWAAEGAQQLALVGPSMPLRTASLEGEVLLNGQAPPTAGSVRAESAELVTPLGTFLLPTAQLGFDAPTGQPLALTVRVRGLTLPANLLPPSPAFGPRIDDLTLDAAVSGPLDTPGPLPRRAAVGRVAGGRMEVKGLTLRWGPTAISAAASLALDDALQPSGAGTVRMANPTATLDALTASGAIPTRTASTIRRVLPLLTRLDPGGGSPVIELPVAVQDRTLSVARFPLMQLQTVEWR